MLINGIKFACNTCVKGHRSSNCNHIERPLFEIRKKGRPVTQCAFCRDLRKTKQIHIKCTCSEKSLKSGSNKNIEHTVTATAQQQEQEQCYQCPSTSNNSSNIEEQGISYSELIQSSLMNNGNTTQKDDGALQCTCHEAANRILLYNQQQGESIATIINKSRGMMIDEQKMNSKPCARFLDGQTKSPRRKSSTSSTAAKRRSIQNGAAPIYQPQPQQQQQQDNAVMADMQSFLYSPQEPELLAANNSNHLTINFPSNISTTTTISSTSSSTPNSNYTCTGQREEEVMMDLMDNRGDIGLMITDPDELTSLLNNVLNNNNDKFSSRQEQDEDMLMMADNTATQQKQPFIHPNAAINMTRSTTNNSISSSSSTSNNNNKKNLSVPQHQQQTICGSFTPHTNCSSAMDTQGESVAITITPLSTLSTSSAAEITDGGGQEKPNNTTKPMTRIVTCYCGTSCICPGCFVHPNNYLDQYNQYAMQFQQQQALSTTNSSCSSDDEDHYHHQLNYTASTTALNYPSSLL